MSHKKNGFVFIEMLVVFSFFVLIFSILSARAETRQMHARDAERIAGVDRIAEVLEEYYRDHGHYPKDLMHTLSYDTSCTYIVGCGHCDRWCEFERVLSPYTYPLPEDPLPVAGRTFFAYTASAGDEYQTYGLAVWLETKDHPVAMRDGGYYKDAYEVGQRPRYCMNVYDGVDADWLWRHDPSPDGHEWEWVCNGGN